MRLTEKGLYYDEYYRFSVMVEYNIRPAFLINAIVIDTKGNNNVTIFVDRKLKKEISHNEDYRRKRKKIINHQNLITIVFSIHNIQLLEFSYDKEKRILLHYMLDGIPNVSLDGTTCLGDVTSHITDPYNLYKNNTFKRNKSAIMIKDYFWRQSFTGNITSNDEKRPIRNLYSFSFNNLIRTDTMYSRISYIIKNDHLYLINLDIEIAVDPINHDYFMLTEDDKIQKSTDWDIIIVDNIPNVKLYQCEEFKVGFIENTLIIEKNEDIEKRITRLPDQIVFKACQGISKTKLYLHFNLFIGDLFNCKHININNYEFDQSSRNIIFDVKDPIEEYNDPDAVFDHQIIILLNSMYYIVNKSDCQKYDGHYRINVNNIIFKTNSTYRLLSYLKGKTKNIDKYHEIVDYFRSKNK